MIKGAVTRPSTTAALAVQVLRTQATLFAEHVPLAQLGADPEHVHISRVATRRLRAALRLFSDILPPDSQRLDAELRWMASQLGPVRDLDVQLKRLEATALALDLVEALAPYAAWLCAQRREAQVHFDLAFQSERFIALTEHLREIAAVPAAFDGGMAVEEDAPQRLRRAHRQLRKRCDGLCVTSPPEAFHRARIGAKRLRYAAEFFEPVYGKPARRLAEAATEIQDLLGDHQDGIVNTQRIAAATRAHHATWPPESMIAVGQLIQWETQHGQEVRAHFPPLYRRVKSAWRRLRHSF
jgi:CHAD domain-containing protein